MDNEYEVFENVDVPDEYKEEENKFSDKLKSKTPVVGAVTLCLVLIVSAVNLVMCIKLYQKYDEIQLNPQLYFQDPINSQVNNDKVIVEYAADDVVIETSTAETTTVKHITVVTSSSQTTKSAYAKTTAEQTTVKSVTATAAAVENETVLVNINTATVEELTALNGIGEKKAQDIVEYREENGRFYSVEEITNVSGIGEKTLEKNIDKMTVD